MGELESQNFGFFGGVQNIFDFIGGSYFSREVQFILCPFPPFEMQDLKKLKNFQSSNRFQYSHFQIQDRCRVDIFLFKEQFLFTSNETQTHEMLSFLSIWWV